MIPTDQELKELLESLDENIICQSRLGCDNVAEYLLIDSVYKFSSTLIDSMFICDLHLQKGMAEDFLPWNSLKIYYLK